MRLVLQRSNQRRLRAGIGLLLFLSIILSSLGTTVVADDKDEEDYKIVAYYAAWSAPENFDPNKVTHINYAFADVCWEGEHGNPDVWVPEGADNTWPCRGQGGEEIDVPNGTVVLGDPSLDTDLLLEGDKPGQPFAGHLNQLVKFKEENPDLKTLISIGGWTWSRNLSLVAATEETREVFAKSAADFVQKYQMDGVDLDWEYPVSGGMENNHRSPEDKENHTLLLEEIREALDEAGEEDGKDYLLTIASSVSFSYLDNNELSKIAEIVDFINIMTYDFNGGWSATSGHNAPLYEDPKATAAGVHPYNIKAAINGHLSNGVPADKLVMGLPFYGRAWGGCNEETNGAMRDNGGYQKCTPGKAGGNLEPGMYDYQYLEENFVNKNGFLRYWNDFAKVPYLYNNEAAEIISYDDAESLTHKVNFIKELGLAGAMIWELSQDDAESTLLTTVANGLGVYEVDDEEDDDDDDDEDDDEEEEDED